MQNYRKKLLQAWVWGDRALFWRRIERYSPCGEIRTSANISQGRDWAIFPKIEKIFARKSTDSVRDGSDSCKKMFTKEGILPDRIGLTPFVDQSSGRKLSLP